jgi:hypothetical protein
MFFCSIQLKSVMKCFFVFIEHIKVSEYFIHNNMYSQIQKERLMVDPCKMYEVAAIYLKVVFSRFSIMKIIDF